MSTPKLTTYTFRVLTGDIDEPEEVTVRSVGADIQRTETYFAEHRWGSTQDRPMTAAAVTAYYAGKRAGEWDGTVEHFLEHYLSVEPAEAVTVTPTEPGPGPG